MSSDKHKCLIIGASRGIGLSVKERFTRAGWQVIAPKRDELNLQYSSHVNRFLKNNKIVYDAIVISAGYNDITPLEDVTLKDLQTSYLVHVVSPFQLVKGLHLNNQIRSGSAIAFISSLYGVSGRAGRLVYSTNKHAVQGLVKSLAIELGKHRIRANSIMPGFANTDMTRNNLGPHGIEKISAKIPLGKIADPEEIGNVVFNLCTENTYINGQSIVVDGGLMSGGFWNDH